METLMTYTLPTIIEEMPKNGWELEAEPIPAGEILQEDFLTPMRISQSELAKKIDCDIKTINKICNGHTAITARTALKLSKFFGTTPEFWLNLQMASDLWHAAHETEKTA